MFKKHSDENLNLLKDVMKEYLKIIDNNQYVALKCKFNFSNEF